MFENPKGCSTRDVHKGFSTRRAALGAADLERALREDRRPLAGIFRVRAVSGQSASWVQDGCLLGCSGTLGVSFGIRGMVRAVSGRVV